MTRAEIKANAKDKLRGSWGWALLVSIVNGIVASLIVTPFATVSILPSVNDIINNPNYWNTLNPSIIFTESMLPIILSGIISGLISLSLAITFLHLRDGKQDGFIQAVFSAFTDDRFGPEIMNYVLTEVFEFLWSLLLVIPGLIKSYSYAMTPYIVDDLVASGQSVDGSNRN